MKTDKAAWEASLLLQKPENHTEEDLQNARCLVYELDDEGYVNFGDVAMAELNDQCQYASRYVYGIIAGYPCLGDGLRWQNYEEGKSSYHKLRIHIDDVAEFIARQRRYSKRRADYTQLFEEDMAASEDPKHPAAKDRYLQGGDLH